MKEKYMELCSRNANKKLSPPVGDEKILIFDIDQCLYHAPEMEEYEVTSIKTAFLNLSKLSEIDWETNQSKHNLYRETFHVILGIHPKEFCDKYENHHPLQFIKKDPELIEILSKIKTRKFCFTNGSIVRASKILQHMELDHLFEVVICNDAEETEFICKPQEAAFKFVDRYLGIKDRKKVYFFDDSQKNINAANTYGWNGLLVEGNIKQLIQEHIE